MGRMKVNYSLSSNYEQFFLIDHHEVLLMNLQHIHVDIATKIADEFLANENLEEAKKQTKLANEKTKLANEQTEVAQEHFLDLRKTVNKFFTVIRQQRLLMEPGFQSLRRER